jgi:hypothetical protein
MTRQLVLVITLLVFMGIWLAFIVWAILKATPIVRRAHVTAGLLARRRELLERAEAGAVSLADADQMVALTEELRAKTSAPHLITALDLELQAAQMARLAVRRDDLDRAKDFLRRIGHRFIGTGLWTDGEL